MDSKDALVVFEGTKIRRKWHDDQWYFSVIDIIEILTDSPTPRQYWGKIKDREFAKLELSPIWVQLKLPAEDGKLRFTDCINTQNAFRLIQFTMLGEKVTTEITRSKNAENFPECKTAAREGGGVAGNARRDAEKKIGRSVISKENYLIEPEKEKRKRLQ